MQVYFIALFLSFSQVWAKMVGKGEFAVVLLNRDDNTTQDVVCSFTELKLTESTKCNVRDIWAHEDVSPATGSVQR